ncbi:MAG: peptidase M16 [Chloroflexi bacterium]|nr:peptidase M16 [Chloroflexota bacterium]
MTDIHGFELVREMDIPELNTRARLFRHAKSGAELLSLENDDENKVFGVAFRTPPTDSTGVAHILEHVVLAGSRKYPVKEPFIELIKGSLKTFLNAFTYPDRTVYPVASQNLQDFYNLIDVYLDAVFHPLLSPHTFAQEGWHYEVERKNGQALSYKGVVFNEMKGAFADPDDRLDDVVRRHLFPDTTYGLESGGDPRRIPELTYEQFLDFHRRYYHPSNALIYFYGDDPPEERLRLMNEWLSEFDRRDVEVKIDVQPRFAQPRREEEAYIAGDDAKAYLTVNWSLAADPDPELLLSLAILTHILIGDPASPLRKALIESGLGEDLAGVGLMPELRQVYFSTGLKGVDPAHADAVERLILDTLEHLAAEGVEQSAIESAMNTIEFRLREQNTGGIPRGLALMLAALAAWTYGRDPMEVIAFEQPLSRIKKRLARGEHYFEDLIRRYFLENPHRVTLLFRPDPDLQKRWNEEEARRLDAIRSAMSPDDLKAVIEEMETLHRLQETPDDPQALAAIPRLKLEDLERENKIIPLVELSLNGGRALYHDLFTNGILYLDVGMDLRGVEQELLPFVPLFGRALLEMGTEDEDYVQLSRRIGSKTGGIRDDLYISSRLASPEPLSWLFLRGKATVERAQDLLDILHDILHKARFDDQERFRQIVLEEKAAQEAQLAPAGYMVVHGRLAAHFHIAGWLTEQMSGVDYLFFLRNLSEQVKKDWPSVLQVLETLRERLIQRPSMLWNVTLDEANWAGVEPRLAAFIGALPASPVPPASWSPTALPPHEGLAIPVQVNYVGKGANLYDLGYRLHGSIHVINRFLATTWLWERVRMKGGAYSGFSLFDQRTGLFDFLSYRDPHLKKTLEIYDQTARFLREVDLSEDELTKSIIGTIGAMDAYLLPDAKGWISMQRWLTGESDAFRQRLREEVLGATKADFRAFADVLERVREAGHVVAMGPQPRLAALKSPALALLKVL